LGCCAHPPHKIFGLFVRDGKGNRQEVHSAGQMPPKKNVEEKPQPTPAQVAKIEENEAIRRSYEEYKSSCRIARDTKAAMPNMMSFARAASEDERVSKNEDAIYSQFKRASKNQSDVVGIMGRPCKGVDTLQMHAFAKKASENVWPRFVLCNLEIDELLQGLESKSCLSKASLAVFDKFAANQQGDPRKNQLSGRGLEDLVKKLKEAEPFLTTTKVTARFVASMQLPNILSGNVDER
jgi:hypothetical protein